MQQNNNKERKRQLRPRFEAREHLCCRNRFAFYFQFHTKKLRRGVHSKKKRKKERAFQFQHCRRKL